MKSLLTISALVEGTTGLALLSIPATVVHLFLGISLSEPGLQIVGGITGAALLSLGFACWSLRSSGPHAAFMVKALLLYNIIAFFI